MTNADLFTRWSLGLAAAVVIVVVVAALLLLIIAAARGVLAAAARCLAAVTAIRANVDPLWQLSTTNDVAERLVGGARSIENRTRLLADAVEAHEPARSGSGV